MPADTADSVSPLQLLQLRNAEILYFFNEFVFLSGFFFFFLASAVLELVFNSWSLIIVTISF